MTLSSLGIRSKILFGMSILVLGYIATVAIGFFTGASREARFGEIREHLIPLTMESERLLYGYDSATKAFDDALMTGDQDQAQSVAKRLKTVNVSIAKTNEIALHVGISSDGDAGLIQRVDKLVSQQTELFASAASASDDAAREALRAKGAALTKETTALRKALADTSEQRTAYLTTALDTMAAQTHFQRFFDLGMSAVVILGSCLLVFVIIQKSIISNVFNVVVGLRTGAVKLDAATKTIGESSHTLADGASQQAASLEETSATLEEISGMAKRNAENSQHAKDRMGKAQVSADEGLADVKALNVAMAEIKTASDNIAKIVKAIDEIAFQTNILALNAAVEAARAGEAGAGFAVVAEEVRNLAQRSAQASRETAQLIEDSIGKSERGARMSVKVGAGLENIAMQVRDVNNLIVEIAQASQEQSSGVSQVNMAVTQLDKLTQSNAATAEESAAAVHELADQSKELHQCLIDLGHIVYGQTFDAEHDKSVEKGSNAPHAKAKDSGKPAKVEARAEAPAAKHPVKTVQAKASKAVADDFFSS